MDAAGLLAVAAPVGVAPQELPDEGMVPGLLDGVGDVAEVPERPLAVADAPVDDEDRALDDGRRSFSAFAFWFCVLSWFLRLRTYLSVSRRVCPSYNAP